VRAQEKTRRAVEIKQAELAVEKERIQKDHEYCLEMLKFGHIPPPHPPGPPTFNIFAGSSVGSRYMAILKSLPRFPALSSPQSTIVGKLPPTTLGVCR